MKNRKEADPFNSEYTLFLGCTVSVRALNYEISARRVAKELGLHFSDIPDFSCCGYPVKSIHRYASLLMAARNLALAEKKGLPLCTLCSACCGSLTEANHEIQNDQKLRARINQDLSQWLGLRYEGSIQVLHLIRVFNHQEVKERILKKIKMDLSLLRTASHYGCHYIKPSTIYHLFDDPENPKSLDELIKASGAQSISYEDQLQCCGGGVLAIDEQVALAMAHQKLNHLRSQQVDAMILICPFCNVMYEGNQRKIEKIYQTEYKLPILYYPQLLGLAFGLNPDELGLKMNRVRTTELLQKIRRRIG